MKRAGSPLDPSTPSSKPCQHSSAATTSSSSSNSMACTHLSQAFTTLAAPRPSQQVHRDECTLCFDDQDGDLGIDVCLTCFNGACPREHSRLHFQKTGHALVANVKRRRKPKQPVSKEEEERRAQQPQKLAIAAESEADKYDWETTPRCLACEPDGSGKVLPRTDKVRQRESSICWSRASTDPRSLFLAARGGHRSYDALPLVITAERGQGMGRGDCPLRPHEVASAAGEQLRLFCLRLLTADHTPLYALI